jgi:AbrB family looped-hinge helix DNA binding protein
MEIQAPTVTTVSTKGQLVIPTEIRESLGIVPGTKMVVKVEGSRIILQPVEKLIQDMRGLFAGEPSLEDELLADRRAEDGKW